jgi:hypothetical protein
MRRQADGHAAIQETETSAIAEENLNRLHRSRANRQHLSYRESIGF